MSKKSYWYYIPYLLLFFYVIFIGISYYQLNERMNYIINYPVKVIQEARDIITRLMEMQHTIPGLLSNPDLKYPAIEKILIKQENDQNESLENIKQVMTNEPGLLTRVDEAMMEIRKRRREAALMLEGNNDYNKAFAVYQEMLEPQIYVVRNAVLDVLNHANQTMEARQRRTDSDFRFCILVTLIVGTIIALSFYAVGKQEKLQTNRLKERDKMFDELSRNVDEIFIISSGPDDFDFVSANSGRLLQIANDQILHNPAALFSIIPQDDAEWLRSRLANLSEHAGSEERIIQFANGIRVFKIGFYPIASSNSDRDAAVIALRDQTHEWEQKQALSDALENAYAASQAKSSFLSHMSHEIRTPMNAIIGMTTIALSKISDTERVVDCLTKITESSKHLLSLINDVLDMSKIENGKLSINHEPFSLPASIRNINDLVRPQAQARQINFEITQENVDEDELIGDSLRLNQILLNILSNSVKFTQPDGTISLHIKQLRKNSKTVRIRFVISDTGIGMSQEFLKRLFKPFEQATQGTAAKYGGTGLGMSITLNLINLMGGTINVESREGKGSTFIVELPFGYNSDAEEHYDTLPPLKVLVVDDDLGTCEHAALLLEKIHVSVNWVTSGVEAIEKVREAHDSGESYDVCFIDWKMPGMDGEETAKRIRNVVGDDMLIIIISAYDWGAIEESAKAAGVNDFVAKPFFASTLFNVLLSTTQKFGLKSDDPANTKQNYDFSGKRILLAEDNEFNREIANEFMDMANAKVDNAENGQEAIDMFGKSPAGYYDMILMDVQMPVMNGYEATRAIRSSSHPNAKTIPILAMTANAFSEDVANATAAGMNGHISKPIDINDLYRLIHAHLKRKTA